VVAALPARALAAVAGARERMLAGQDAFDAAVSAIVLSRGETGLEAPAGEAARREGWIWGARPAPPSGDGRGACPAEARAAR
jgi:hypothetical protein